jgi:hypothetical protein
MTRKIGTTFLGLIIMFGLSQCQSKAQSKLVGVWQLQELVVNGAVLKGSSLGTWLWEFNTVGGYLTDVAGVREKGRFTLKDSVLTLKVLIPQNGAGQTYRVTKIDSADLDLLSIENRNKTTLRFIKRKASEVTGGDKD